MVIPVMNRRTNRSRFQEHPDEITQRADPLCPRCGYCLIGTISPPCPECAYLYDRVDPVYLPKMYNDVRAEHTHLRTLILCYLCFLALGAYKQLRLPIDWVDMIRSGIVAALILLGMIIFKCSTLTRHEKRSRLPDYDGTTPAGTYAIILIALITIPILLMLTEIAHQIFQRVF